MIFGIGTDITEVSRIQSAARRKGNNFLHRLFTYREQYYCDNQKQRWCCYAGRFAAKEAIFKSLGTGIAGCRWTDVEVVNESSGKPVVLLWGSAAELAKENKIREVLISISHDRERAVAFAVALKGEGGVYFAGSESC